MLNSSQHGFSSTQNRKAKAEKIALIINEITGGNNHQKPWLLDVGTGNGEIADYLNKDFHVISIDVKDQRSCKSNFHFLIANEYLPFQSNFFDVVVSNHVLEHVRDSKHHIDEIYRVIKPGGWLYLATPNRLWPWEVHYKTAFLHYLPANIFHGIMKKTGQYEEDVNLKTTWQIRSICSSFKRIESISEKICQRPTYYKLNTSRLIDKILSLVPLRFFSIMHIFMPTFIFMMQKNKKDKPSVLWLTSSYPRYDKDTASIFLRYLAESLETKFKIHILSPDHDLSNTHPSPKKTHYYFRYFLPKAAQKLAYNSGILPNIKNNKWLLIQAPFFIVSQFIASCYLINKLKPDLIHAHWIFPQGLIATLGGKIFSVPVIVTAHGGDAFALQGNILNMIKRWTIRNCTYWTSNTKITSEAFGNKLPPPKIIPMGVHCAKFKSGDINYFKPTIPRELEIILFVGRLVEKKGVKDLLTAFSLLPDPYKENCQLWIVGDGIEKNALIRLSEDLSINECTVFWGNIANDLLPNYYARANIFVAPSTVDSQGDTEGQGIILLEALASGTATISTKTGGVTEIIEHNKTGILVPPNSPNDLKNAIELLLVDKEKRYALGIEGQVHAQVYNWDTIGNQFSQLYAQCIE